METKKELKYENDQIIPIYEKEFVVGFDDIGKMLSIKNTALLKYVQQIAMEHADTEGFGYLHTIENGMAWIICSWKVEVINRPKYAENFKIKTWRHDNTKIRAYRDFEIYTKTNELVARISSLWLLLDLETRKIVPMSSDTVKKFNVIDKHTFENIEFKKIPVLKQYDIEKNYKIQKRDLDLNKHMNNQVYLELAYEIIPSRCYEDKDFSKFEIEYKKEITKEQKEILICAKLNEKDITVAFYNTDKTVLHAICKLMD